MSEHSERSEGTDADTHSCMLCGAGWRGEAIPEERYREVLRHLPPSAFFPEISEATFHLVDGILCRLETQGRPSQCADAGWHEALAVVRETLLTVRAA